MTTTLTLAAHADRLGVASEITSTRMIEWIVQVQRPDHRQERAPLNLALVLDRSGSMGGDKLRYIKQAACHVLDLLDERDRVALVAYDDQVTLLAPSESISPATRAAHKARIEALTPGGWTDLSGGWLEGCRAVAAQQIAQDINRSLLLTDGLANRGITDIEELTHHARQLRRRGVTTSTFGVGLDFNEVLLEALATEGGGHFYYIEQPEQIPDMFRRELGELLTIVAREALLRIELQSGIGIELLGELPHERTDTHLRVYLGDLFAGEQRAIYTRALFPPDAPGTSVALNGELGYAELDGQFAMSVATVMLNYAREAEVRLMRIDEGVSQRASEVELATAATQALKLERAGQRAQAQTMLAKALAATMGIAPAPVVAAYQALEHEIGEGVSEERRKEAQYDAYQKRHSRR